MADSKDFPSQKDYSSRSSEEHPSMYSTPTQATSQDDRPSSSALTFGSARPESAAEGGRTSERTPSPVQKPASQSASMSHSNEPTGENDRGRGHGDEENGASEHSDDSDTASEHGDQSSPKEKCKHIKVLCTVLLILLGLGILGGTVGGEFGIRHGLPNRREQETNSKLADLRPNDTILLYQGNSSQVTISEVLPVAQKPDVSLFATECTDLIRHVENRSLTGIPLNVTSSSPFSIPSDPLHYELGSTIIFTIEIIDASEDSTLTLLMFDNATKANKYSQSPNAGTGAQAIRHWSIDMKEGGNSTHNITFMPSYGSYYIPVFSPVPRPILNIDLSYNITQVFYFHADYTQYTNCSLNLEPCSLHFSTGNESCILAYIPPSTDKVTLQTHAVIGEEERANDHLKLAQVLIGIGGGIALILTVVVIIVVISVYVRKWKEHKYIPLQETAQ